MVSRRKLHDWFRGVQDWALTNRRSLLEASGLAAFFLVVFNYLAATEAFEAFHAYSRFHEEWDLDELVVAIVPAFFVAIAVATRRALDARSTQRALRQTLAQVEVLLAEQGVLRGDAEDANQAKSMFLTNMSHELRTPLNAIIGYTEIVVEDLTAENPEHPSVVDLDRVGGAARHLLALINGILDLSKIEAGRFELVVGGFPAAYVVDEVAGIGAPLAEKSGARLVWESVDLGHVHSDEKILKQCLLNFVSNACKFTPGGEVRISAERLSIDGKEMLRFRVTDTGIGMSAEELGRIFKPFMQANSSVAQRFGGTGLGLSITRHLAEMLGGEATLESELGVGTTATLTIAADLRQAEGSASEVDALVGQPSQPLALVIEDDVEARDLIARTLSPVGFAVQGVGTARTGLRLARERTPSIIVLDVFLPDASGWGVLDELKRDPILSAIPVVVLSVSDERARSIALGAADHVVKPIRRDLLANLVLRLARTPAQGESSASSERSAA